MIDEISESGNILPIVTAIGLKPIKDLLCFLSDLTKHHYAGILVCPVPEKLVSSAKSVLWMAIRSQ